MSEPSSNLLATHANCLPVGTIIADFEIIGLVGEGGFGIVYLARDLGLDRVVAVKEFMPAAFAGRVDGISVAVRSSVHRATYDAGLRSFINEAKMLAKFAHPALVEVYRFWEGNGTAYMAMRYYAGETLRQQLTHPTERFDEQFIAQTMAPIFDALEMLHREQVFHRDIAPDNIMLAGGQSVLLDFGAARRIIGDGTQALTTILKPGYAPIEQYVDDGTMKQGPWTDVYALGGVLYNMATGKAPCQAVSRLLSDPLLTVNQVVPDRFSEAFSSAVANAMAVRVDDRLQSIREFSEMLGWNTAKPTRVMTVPKTSYALPATDKVEPSISLELAAPTPLETPADPVAHPAELPVSGLQDRHDPMLEAPSRVDPPAKQLEIAVKRSLTIPLVAVGLGVLAVGVFLSTRPAEPMAEVPKQIPVNTPVAVKAQTIPQAPVVEPAPSALTAVAATGIVELNISPWGTLVVDGVTRGITNPSKLRRIELSVGTHTIEIAKPDFPVLKQTIEVKADKPLNISHTFK